MQELQTSAPVRTAKGRLVLVGVLLAVTLATAWGLLARRSAAAALRDAARAAVPVEATTLPDQGSGIEEIALPGQVRGAQETAIRARVAGYVRSWHADIGDHVARGQLLAVVEAPELDEQVRQAQAELARARAVAAAARSAATRAAGLAATASVSRQEDEERRAAALAAEAAVTAASADLARLRRLQGFERVTAPYPGTVTARSTDRGDLVNPAATSGAELFRIADATRLRAFVQVPQSIAARIRPGQPVTLAVPGASERPVAARVTRTAAALDPGSRTLEVEIDVGGQGAALLPGAFLEVRFALPAAAGVTTVPPNALMFDRRGVQVATVGTDRRVRLRRVETGRDLGASVEIVSGLGPLERVVLNPAPSLEEGDLVEIVDLRPRTRRPGTGLGR